LYDASRVVLGEGNADKRRRSVALSRDNSVTVPNRDIEEFICIQCELVNHEHYNLDAGIKAYNNGTTIIL